MFSQKYLIISVLVLLLAGNILFLRFVLASTNINATSTSHWAWNDFIGWINFYETNSITVSDTGLTGYASSSAGDISLDCHTTRNGPDCAANGGADYQVTNDGVGDLSGWGWNDTYGWISFDCHNNGACGSGPGSSTYEVTINPQTGDFSGYAWNDEIGWIDFNCSPDYCGGGAWKVNTSWTATSTSGVLDSAAYDTGVPGGAEINSILWQGNLPAGTQVDFQLAGSNSPNGPWTFIGPDGTTGTHYAQLTPGTSRTVDFALHNNYRYFRYRAYLYSNQVQTLTPRIDDININWSP